MANTTAKLVAAYFDSLDLKYDLTGENEHVILTGFRADNKEAIKVGVIFDDDGERCSLFTRDYCHVPENKMEGIYKVLNGLNQKFRWVRFYVDDDGDIRVESDAVIDMDTCGKECHELISRICSIADQAYPDLMRAIFA